MSSGFLSQAAEPPPGPTCILICPGDITRDTDQQQCGAQVDYNTPTASGDCTGLTVQCTPPSGFFAVGTTLVHCTATDADDKSVAGCTFNVLIKDAELPQISYPSKVSQCTDPGQGSAAVEFNVRASDNCGESEVTCSPNSGARFPIGTTRVQCSGSSKSGEPVSASFDVTINDCDATQITCPSDITKCTDSGTCTAVVTFDVAATHAATVVCSPKSGSEFAKGTTPVTCTAADPAGKTVTCGFNVTVNNCEDPQIRCPGNITRCKDAAKETAVVMYTVEATDNCGSVTVECKPTSGSEFPNGTTTVSCKASSGAAKSADCSFTVTVNDCQAPQINCPTDVVKCTDPGKCSALVAYDVPASSGSKVECNPKPGSEFAKGATTVTCTVTDGYGNSAHCAFSVTVKDCEAPKIVCPGNLAQHTDNSKQTAVVAFNVSATDSCGAVPVTCEPKSGSEFAQGTTTVICKATDAAENASTCQFTVTVTAVEVDGNGPVPTVSTLAATPSVLWPPNHQMVPVTLTVATSSGPQPASYKIISVASNEDSTKNPHKGSAASQWKITGDLTLELQAERSGSGSGRIYTITVLCQEPSGKTSTLTVAVRVAHDHSQLSHGRNGSDLTLSWDDTDTESVLESTESLSHPDWKPVPKGAQNRVSASTSQGSRFYRLRP